MKRLLRIFTNPTIVYLFLGAALGLMLVSLAGLISYPETAAARNPQKGAAREAAVTQRPQMDGVDIPMRDGKSLKADIWLPAKTGEFPTILMMTPYNRKLLGASLPDPAFVENLLDREHYAYVIVDWRGFHGSKDAKTSRLLRLLRHETLLSQLSDDGYDTVEWVAKQPWSNGKVGMWGPSALARIQYFTAATRPPHLVCAVPAVSSYGYSYDTYYFGGVLKQGYLDILGRVGYGLQRQVLNHPSDDQFWRNLASLTNFNRIDVPMLIITGWYDLYPEGALAAFANLRRFGGPRARQNARLLIGPWHHTAVGKLTQGELQFPQAENVNVSETRQFFDYWLRGQENNGWDRRPLVRYFQMGRNQWHEANSFPPANLSQSAYYLHGGKILSPSPPKINLFSSSFRYDPDNPSPTVGGMNVLLPKLAESAAMGAGPRDQRQRVEGRGDALVFTTEVLTNEVRFEGDAMVKLFVSSDREDTDFAIRLCDVYPDGRTMLIADGIQRMRFRDSQSREELMVPGRIYPVTVRLSPSAYTFLKGHRICVIVTSSNYPRFAVNPNVGRKRLLGRHKLVAMNQVFQDQTHPSALILPVGQ